MKGKYIRWISITFASLVLVSGFFYFLMNGRPKGNKDSEAALPQPTAVRVVRPEIRDMEIGVSYVGTVFSQKEVKVIARVSGTILELPFREGELAVEGSILARVDAPEIRAQVERLTVDRDYWARRHEADKRLVEKNALASEQVDAGDRSLRTTEAALSEAVSQLRKTQERAPFDGTILSWYAEPGQSVLPGQPILLFGSNAGELRVEVAEEDLLRGIKSGTMTEIEFTTGEIFTTAVTEISPAASGRSRTFTVKMSLPKRSDLTMRVGSSLRVKFILRSYKDALTVPASAVSTNESSPHIFLVRDSRAIRMLVKPGIESQGRVILDFPWNGEDKVAISNLGALSNGTPVFAVDAGEVAE